MLIDSCFAPLKSKLVISQRSLERYIYIIPNESLSPGEFYGQLGLGRHMRETLNSYPLEPIVYGANQEKIQDSYTSIQAHVA